MSAERDELAERIDAIRAATEDVHDDAEGTFKGSEIRGLLAEIDRLTSANDRLAKIASSVAVALEQGKRDLMAHGWETATAEWLTRGDLYWLKEQGEDPLTYNPYRGEPEGLEP